jgi:hypothetical protein
MERENFVWRPEEQKLSKIWNGYGNGLRWTSDCFRAFFPLNPEDKKDIEYAFIAIQTYGSNMGKVIQYFALKPKYDEAIKNGEIKTKESRWGDGSRTPYFGSLKAWLIRNGVDVPSYADSVQDLLKVSRGGFHNYCMLNWDTGHWDNFIVDCFYDTLCSLYSKENKWFKEHDEYTILHDKLDNMLHTEYLDSSKVDFSIWTGSRGIILAKEEEGKETQERKLTIDEIKSLIAFYEDFDKKAKEYFTENFPVKSFN